MRTSVDPTTAVAIAIDHFRAIVGSEHVLITREELLDFRDPFQPETWDRHMPSAVIQPDSVEQIQAIVRVAGEYRVPLWTGSQGRNNGYGGGGPRLQGSVVVNLRRMNRILEIDDELGYALIEPGVSFMELYTALRDGDHKWALSAPGIGWGSVVGNTLDHGVTFLEYGADHALACGLEVVTADGGLLRTGTGGVPGSETWNLYKRGLGPSLDQLFMQSNFGIVTKMGVWLQPMPEYFMPIQVNADTEEAIVPLVDRLRELRLDRTVGGVPSIFNTVTAATMRSSRKDWWQGEGAIPEHVLERIATELGVGRWDMRLSLWGDGALVDHHYEKVRKAFTSIPGVSLLGHKVTPDEALELPHPHDRVSAGHASLALISMAGWKGGTSGGHMDFASVVPLRGATILEYNRTFRPLVEAAGMDFKSDILAISARSGLYVSGANFDVTDADEVGHVRETLGPLIEEAGRRGYGQYRAHLNFMDLAAAQYSFNDGAYLRFVEKIKDAVDPKGILAPGKQGIWPRSYREG